MFAFKKFLKNIFSIKTKKNYQETHFEPDKIQKTTFYKPIILFYNTEKLIEQFIKTSKNNILLYSKKIYVFEA
jgi:hypothetical protein